MKKLIISCLFSFILIEAYGARISGTMKVGSGQAYTTISSAVTAMEINGITGTVLVELHDTEFNERINLVNSINYENVNDSIIFIGINNPRVYEAGSALDSFIVHIGDKENIVFKNIEFENTTADFCRIFYIESGVSNLKLEGCALKAPLTTGNAGTGQGSLFYDQSNSYQNSNFEIESCEFEGGAQGVRIWGKDSATPFVNLKVIESKFVSQSYSGFSFSRGLGLVFENNKIFSNGHTPAGVRIAMAISGYGNFNVKNNHIDWDGFAVDIANYKKVNQGERLFFHNNKVRSSHMAIRVVTSTDVEIFNNSLYSGPNEMQTVFLASPTNFELKNNIIHNADTGGIMLITNPGNMISDNNVLYCSDPSRQIAIGNLWYDSGTIGAQGYEQNSIFQQVSFRDTVSLELKCPDPLVFKVFPKLNGVDEDYDGELRENITWPGADIPHINPETDLVTIDGWLTSGNNDTLKNANIKLYADVTGKKIFDVVSTVVTSDGYFKFDNIEGHSPIYIQTFPLNEDAVKYVPAYHGGTVRWDGDVAIDINTCSSNHFNIQPRKLGDLNVVLGPEGNSIEGTVYLESSGKTTNPIPGLDVVLDKIPPANGQTVAVTKTDANGDYSFWNLPDSTFRVLIDYPGIGLTDIHEVSFNSSGIISSGNDYCVDTTSTVDICSVSTNVQINQQGSSFNIFPNPVENEINVNVENLDFVRIIDLSGKIIKESKDEKISLAYLNKGMYLIQVFVKNGDTYVQTFVKK